MVAQRNKRYVVTLGDSPGEQLVDETKFTGYIAQDGSEYWQSDSLELPQMLELVQEVVGSIDEPRMYIEVIPDYRDIIVIDTSKANGDRAMVLNALDDLFSRAEENITLTEPFRISTSKATFITWKENA